jgi:peptidoglycan/xylan/chitin deacetylase (PgdA/CDA1 family)
MVSNSSPLIFIVGRLSGPKNDLILKIIRDVAPAVRMKLPRVSFLVAGGPVGEDHLELQRRFEYVRFEGHVTDLKPYYRKAAVVIGSGRAALEAMALKKPVLAVGERLYVGPLAGNNLETAKASNFGDCWERETFDWPRMVQDLLALLKSRGLRERTAQTGFQLVQSEYNLEVIFPQVEAVYQDVLLKKNAESFHELPVLMYHRVVETPPVNTKFDLHIIRDDLEKQLVFLKAHGYETITFEDLLLRRVPKKPVILTFDDGYEDNYHYLFPLLEQYAMKAVLYVLGSRKNRDNFWDIPKGEPRAALLNPSQIKEMAASGLVEFGSHSINHVSLTEIGARQAESEIRDSKKALEDLLKKPVVSFAYPYGAVNEETKKITARSGYTFGIAVNSGPTRFGEDLLEIRRVHMFPKTSGFEFWKKTSGFYLRYRKWKGE